MLGEIFLRAKPASGQAFESLNDKIGYNTCVAKLEAAVNRVGIEQVEQLEGSKLRNRMLQPLLRWVFRQATSDCGFAYDTFDNAEIANSYCALPADECPLRRYGRPAEAPFSESS